MMRPIHLRAPMRDQIAGNLEEEVAQEEDPGAQSVDGVAPAEVAHHLELGEADVDPVKIADHVGKEEQRDDPPGHFPVQPLFQRGPSSLGE